MITYGSKVRVIMNESNDNDKYVKRHQAIGHTGKVVNVNDSRLAHGDWAFYVKFDDPRIEEISQANWGWLWKEEHLEEVVT